MIETGLTIAAGVAALVGIGAIVLATTARSERGNQIALRCAQAGLSLAGVLMFLSYFAAGEAMSLFGGLMLLVFGTGMTAIGRRSRPKA